MLKISTLTSRARYVGTAVVLVGVTLAASLQPMLAGAEQVTNRSLQLSSTAPGTATGDGLAGSGTNGQKATYTFRFTVPTDANIQSWSVAFCTTPFSYVDTDTTPRALTSPCAAGETPAGLNATLAPAPVVTVNGGSAETGWSTAAGSQNNVIRITNGTPLDLDTGDVVQIAFPATGSAYITNPSAAAYPANTFFGHMMTYSDATYTEANAVDDGTVTSATTTSVALTARVQETLKFSVGTAVAGSITAPNSTCDTLAGTNTLTLGDAVNQALATGTAYDAHSYFRLSTNASGGTDVKYAGRTLTSGSNTIDPAGTSAAFSAPGTEMFGLGYDSGDTATNFTAPTVLSLVAPYSNADGDIQAGNDAQFGFDTASNTAPVTLANATAVVPCDTVSVRYVGNINVNTPAGIYRTSINYIAVPRY